MPVISAEKAGGGNVLAIPGTPDQGFCNRGGVMA